VEGWSLCVASGPNDAGLFGGKSKVANRSCFCIKITLQRPQTGLHLSLARSLLLGPSLSLSASLSASPSLNLWLRCVVCLFICLAGPFGTQLRGGQEETTRQQHNWAAHCFLPTRPRLNQSGRVCLFYFSPQLLGTSCPPLAAKQMDGRQLATDTRKGGSSAAKEEERQLRN